MNNHELKGLIEQHRIISIVRKIYGNELIKLAKALYTGGIRLLEITFDQSDPRSIQLTSGAIRMLTEEMSGEMVLGAGTVLTIHQVEAAMSAGAHYVVTPNTDENVIRFCKENGLLVIPGAMTPTEMVDAVHFGADYVKVFPFSDLGFKYIKSVMTPLNHIKFIATGGVSIDNLKDVFQAGFVAAGIGGFLADKDLVARKEFGEIANRAKNFVDIVHNPFKD